jgi:hypothetical protein
MVEDTKEDLNLSPKNKKGAAPTNHIRIVVKDISASSALDVERERGLAEYKWHQ